MRKFKCIQTVNTNDTYIPNGDLVEVLKFPSFGNISVYHNGNEKLISNFSFWSHFKELDVNKILTN